MTDQITPDVPTPETPSSGGLDDAAGIVDKIANMGRTHMASAVGLLLPAAGLLAFLGSLYLAFQLVTHDWLELSDVLLASFGIVASMFLFAVLLGVHGFNVFKRARKFSAEGMEPRSSTILRALAGALRGYGEAFLVAVLVAMPFLGLQALIADRNAPIPLFGEGLVGVVIMPIIYAIMMLLFSYLIAELIETLLGIREKRTG